VCGGGGFSSKRGMTGGFGVTVKMCGRRYCDHDDLWGPLNPVDWGETIITEDWEQTPQLRDRYQKSDSRSK